MLIQSKLSVCDIKEIDFCFFCLLANACVYVTVLYTYVITLFIKMCQIVSMEYGTAISFYPITYANISIFFYS